MLTKFILIVIIAISSSNKKTDGPKSAIALLTQKPWTPVSHGYDDNQNGSIDGFEESITDCEKDDHYGFSIGGNGFFDDKNISCGNGISEMAFTWRFINEQTLDFLFETVKISRLSNTQLIVYRDVKKNNGRFIRYIQIFKH